MNIKKLISKGYFPTELPPPFNTELLGEEADEMFNHFTNLDNGIKKDFRETLNFKLFSSQSWFVEKKNEYSKPDSSN